MGAFISGERKTLLLKGVEGQKIHKTHNRKIREIRQGRSLFLKYPLGLLSLLYQTRFVPFKPSHAVYEHLQCGG
jgi:hypothetical protein